MVLKWVGVVATIGMVSLAAAAYAAFGAFLPWREESEAARLAEVAGVRSGHRVAEIGAGSGRFAVAMARTVGPTGKVFATEVNPDRRNDIRGRVAAAGLDNVTVVDAGSDHTNLPPGCCDVVFLRNVYHHLEEPERFATSMARAVTPGGRAVVIDFEPGALWLHVAPADAGGRRPGHGVARADVIAEMRAAGFNLRQEVPRWGGPMWMALFER